MVEQVDRKEKKRNRKEIHSSIRPPWAHASSHSRPDSSLSNLPDQTFPEKERRRSPECFVADMSHSSAVAVSAVDAMPRSSSIRPTPLAAWLVAAFFEHTAG